MRAAATPIAARILQQRNDAKTLTPQRLVAALASEGVTADLPLAKSCWPSCAHAVQPARRPAAPPVGAGLRLAERWGDRR